MIASQGERWGCLKNKKIKPPISYYGGKQRMAPHIIPLIPKHTVYVEPFVGGGAIFFMKPLPAVKTHRYYREVINDTDGNLVNFYKQLRDNGEELVRLLELTPYSREEFKNCSPDKINCENQLERARRYFSNVMMSFSRILGNSWGTSVWGMNLGSSWKTKIHELNKFLQRMEAVIIENDDACECIKRWDSPQTFFYCDPPYPDADQGHYKGYTKDDFHKLVETLDNMQGSFLLSCYDFEGIKTPSNWERFEFEAHCSASGEGRVGIGRDKSQELKSVGNRKRVEIVYRRLNRVPVRKGIQELYNRGYYNCFVGGKVGLFEGVE